MKSCSAILKSPCNIALLCLAKSAVAVFYSSLKGQRMCYGKSFIEHFSSPGFSSITNVNTAIKAAKPVSRTVCVPDTWAPTSAGLSRALVRRLWGYHRASLARCTEHWRWGWWRRHGCRKWRRMVVVTAEMTDRIGQAIRG